MESHFHDQAVKHRDFHLASRFSLLPSWRRALMKLTATWESPPAKEPGVGSGQEPARNWCSQSNSPWGGGIYQQPCGLRSRSFPSCIFRWDPGPGWHLDYSHNWTHSTTVLSPSETPSVAYSVSRVSNEDFSRYKTVMLTYHIFEYRANIYFEILIQMSYHIL